MDFVKDIENLLKKGHSGQEIVLYHSKQVDRYIKSMLPEDFADHSFAIFATGGYGRCELAPYSDIDLMFFAKDINDTQYIEALYYKLLDSGLRISHSFRTPNDCLYEINKDIRTRTSLLDARFIAGDNNLIDVFRETVYPEVAFKEQRSFFSQRSNELKVRHKKYGQSIYLLEPNIKESQGGLRDIHEALWLCKVALNIKCIKDFQKILGEEDFRRFEKAYNFLLRLRIALHIVIGRYSDILSYEYQERVAKLMGLKDSERFHSTERLLRFYYFMAKTIKETTSRLRNISVSSHIKIPVNYGHVKLNKIFSFLQNRIIINDYEIMKKEPYRLFDAYLLYAKTGKEFSSYLTHYIKKNIFLINEKVRKSAEAVKTFKEILNSERVYNTLRMMHDDGILAKFIPEFSALRFLVVNEPYHTYTVDEHTLRSLMAIEELKNPKDFFTEHLYNLFINLNEKEVIYFSLLFHDIGKSRGKLHSAEGYKSIKSILDKLIIKQNQREIIEFLVNNHLIMARYAFHKDIEDPENISQFSELVKSELLLNLLLLITYADMASVNPDFLSEWKKHLLFDLYNESRKYIRGIEEDPDKYIDNIIGMEERASEIHNYLKKMPERYLLSSTPEKILKEFYLIDILKKNNISFTIDQKEGGATEISILAWDRPGLLSDIVGVFSQRRLNIISLKTFICQDGFVIDRVKFSNWDEMWWEGMNAMLESEIKDVVQRKKQIKLNKYCKTNKRFAPFIEVENKLTSIYTTFETMSSDRIGLLYDLTNVFTRNNMNISLARINTESDVAHDVFYVSKNSARLSTEDIYNAMIQLWEIL